MKSHVKNSTFAHTAPPVPLFLLAELGYPEMDSEIEDEGFGFFLIAYFGKGGESWGNPEFSCIGLYLLFFFFQF